MNETTTIFTIGHGRHSAADFLALLQRYEIEFVCDVRSVARSRWPQFNGPVLSSLLNDVGFGYEHIPETGGKRRPTPEELDWGIGRLIELAADARTAIMCSESRPLTAHRRPRANCHRVGLLAPLLRNKGVDKIVHILPDGTTAEFDEAAVEYIF